MTKLSEELFAIKLYEMEQEYGKLQTRLRVCCGENHQKILQELEQAQQEYEEQALLLRQSMEHSRSQAVAALAEIQLECRQKSEELLKHQLAQDLHSESATSQEDQAEAAALYAEYAMDFSTQAVQYAMIAALKAIDLQMNLEEQKEDSQHV